jgi:hypothetical protein
MTLAQVFPDLLIKRELLTSSQKLAFRICHGFDHVFAITGIEEKLPAFCIRNELNKVGITTY